jgi:type VI secretion system protein ImpK
MGGRSFAMTGRNASFGSDARAPAGQRLHDAQPEGGDATRIGNAIPEEGTVFAPSLAEQLSEPPAETVFLSDRPPDTRPPEVSGQASVREDALLGAFAEVPYEAGNPLLAAAAPLLMLLGDLRLLPSDPEPEPLRRYLSDAIREFERKASDSGTAEDDARIARYVLCETADDLVGGLPGVDRAPWLRDGMLMRFFRADTAGAGFYEALNAVLADPEPHCDLLELMHACLSLGFEGQYRARPDGRQALERVRRDIYETLRQFRPRAAPELSPQWEGLGSTLPRARRIPLWAVAAALPALVAAAFFAARIVVADRAATVTHQLANLNPRDPAILQHAAFVPHDRPAIAATPPVATPTALPSPQLSPAAPSPALSSPPAQPDTQMDRLRNALATGIADRTLVIATKGEFVAVAIAGAALFDPGSARVKRSFDAIARDIVRALDKEQGPLTIVGYTDDRKPGAASVFKSNYDLSLARAKAVKDILIRTIGDPSRLHIEGRGDQVVENGKAEGSAGNRRLDILIRREQTP